MGKKTVREVKVIDLEKRKVPAKHYVYILEVSWSEGTTTLIYRRYSDFFEFQCELLERFPEESGAKDPAARMIPFLPGKKLFGRSHVRAVAEKRKDKLNDYCRTLIRLPSKISDDQFVIDFFDVRPEDLNPTTTKPSKKTSTETAIQEISEPLVLERFVAMADYEKQKKNECSLVAGQTIEVIDKNANGWWFVNVDDFNEGWVPATYLEPLYGSEDVGTQVLEAGEEEVHIAMASYTPQNEDELAFEKGVLLEVFEKNLDGWWKVRYQGKEGFVPAAYLQRYHGAVITNEVTTGAQVVTSLKDAISSTDQKSSLSKPTKSVAESASRKPVESVPVSTKPAESATWKPMDLTQVSLKPVESATSKPADSSHVFSKSTESASWKPAESARVTSPDPKPKPFEPPKTKTVDPARSTSPKTAESATTTSPKMTSPKLENKQKFAPTWHSAQPYIDKEPIYAPTPRISHAKKKQKPPPPPLKPKPTSPSSTSPVDEDAGYALPAPVYECIDHPKEQIYLTIGDFKPGNTGDGLSFTAGVLVSVITKNPTGWWYVDLDGVEGWVPSSYLESTASKPSSPVGSTEPPPPLPVRNSISTGSKRDLFTSPVKPVKSTPIKEKAVPKNDHKKESFEKPARPTPNQGKTLPKNDHSSVTKIKSFGLPTSSSRSSLRRSQSTESLDRDPPPKPSRRANSPPPIHMSVSNSWKPKPGPARPAITVKSPAPPKRSEAKKPAVASTTVPSSPRTARLTKAQISDPMPHKSPTPGRHSSATKTTSPQTKSVSPRTATLSTTKSNSSLHTPESNNRSTSIGSRPAKPAPFTASPAATRKSKEDLSRSQPRKVSGVETAKRPVGPRKSSDTSPKYPVRGGDSASSQPPFRRGTSEDSIDSGPHHLSELESKLRRRGGGNKPSDDKSKKATLPQRPSAPPSRPRDPPKRPDPPRPTGGKKVPPPRPAASPPVKRNVAYVSVGDYSGEVDSCLSFSEGDWVNVIEKNNDGWWFVEIDGTQGWAPSSFLEEKEKPVTDKNTTMRPSRPSLTPPQRPAVPDARNGPSIPSRPRPPPPTKRTSSEEHPPSDTPSNDSDTTPANAPKPKPRARPRKPSVNFVRASSAYKVPAYEDQGVALVEGRLYEVKERRDSGWWLVKDGDVEGWAPASHFENL